MGFFDFLFKEKKKQVIVDDFFGEIKFFRIKNKALDGYFEGVKYFSPLKKEIEFFLDANEEGSTQSQKDFYLELEAKYNSLISDIKIELEELFKNIDDSFTIKDFHNEFTLVSLSLPNFIEKPLEWDLTYESIYDKNHIFTVYYNDWKIKSIGMDG